MAISHKKPLLKSRGRNRKSRPKSFKTAELANTWAKANNITNYKLVNLRPNSKIGKFRIEFSEQT